MVGSCGSPLIRSQAPQGSQVEESQSQQNVSRINDLEQEISLLEDAHMLMAYRVAGLECIVEKYMHHDTSFAIPPMHDKIVIFDSHHP